MCSRRDAVQFGAAHGGSGRRANGSAVCQLVRVVRALTYLTQTKTGPILSVCLRRKPAPAAPACTSRRRCKRPSFSSRTRTTPLSTPLPAAGRTGCSARSATPRTSRRFCRVRRGAAGPDEGSRDRPDRSELDDHELFADLRKPAFTGRARRRPDRPPASIPHRPGHIHGRFAWLRARGERRGAVRRSRWTGTRSRAPLPRRSVDHHLAIQGP